MKYVVFDSSNTLDSIWTRKTDAKKRSEIIDGFIISVVFDDFSLLKGSK